MAIRVDEVIFHQHLEECSGPQTSDHRIQRMFVVLEVCDRNSLRETLNQYRIGSFFVKSCGETHLFVALEVTVESVEVVLLNREVYLFDQCSFEGICIDRNVIRLRKE